MNYFQKTVILIVIFALGIYVGQNYPVPFLSTNNSTKSASISSSERPDLNQFWAVWDMLDQRYLRQEKIDPKKMIDGAISGMVNALGDPYTVYLPTEENKAFNENLSGKYSGVGIQLGFQDQKMVVIAPLDDTPAQRAGIKSGDQIVKIGDKASDQISLPEAVSLIRGDAGTEVKISLYRTGQADPFEVTLKREEITVKTVTVSKLPENTAYIKLTQFGDNTVAEFDDAVKKITTEGYSKAIIDLRNNPGGRLDAVVRIISDFVPSGVAAKQEWYDGRQQDYKVIPGGRLTKLPLIVLVNKGSASASEIFAGSMQDHKRAQIVGEKSFGKGTVQEVESFNNDGSSLHITSSRWLTPNGTWVDETKGITPDVEVKVDPNAPAVELEKDPYILKALELF